MHAADSWGQTRVCWTSIDSGDASLRRDYMTGDLPTLTNQWTRVGNWGPFPCRNYGQGVYQLRTRVAAYISTAGTYDVRVVWGPAALAEGDAVVPAPSATSNILVTGGSNTASAWLTPSSPMLTLDEDRIRGAGAQIRTVPDLGGTDATDVNVTLTTLEVWTRRLSGGGDVRITGLYAQEYLPP